MQLYTQSPSASGCNYERGSSSYSMDTTPAVQKIANLPNNGILPSFGVVGRKHSPVRVAPESLGDDIHRRNSGVAHFRLWHISDLAIFGT